MLETIISSKTRIKLLLKFFLNPKSSAYLRSLEAEFGDSTNAIRLELNRFEVAGMLESLRSGNRKVFKANTKHPLFNELRSLVLKHTGLDTIVELVVMRLGHLKKVYLTGDLAQGKNSDIIDLIFIGDPDLVYLHQLIPKVEEKIKRRIRYLIYSENEAQNISFPERGYLLLWQK